MRYRVGDKSCGSTHPYQALVVYSCVLLDDCACACVHCIVLYSYRGIQFQQVWICMYSLHVWSISTTCWEDVPFFTPLLYRVIRLFRAFLVWWRYVKTSTDIRFKENEMVNNHKIKWKEVPEFFQRNYVSRQHLTKPIFSQNKHFSRLLKNPLLMSKGKRCTQHGSDA